MNFRSYFRKRSVYNTLQLPTHLGSTIAFGGCDYNKLYVLTGQTQLNILTAAPVRTVDPPGGSLLILTGVGRGCKANKVSL